MYSGKIRELTDRILNGGSGEKIALLQEVLETFRMFLKSDYSAEEWENILKEIDNSLERIGSLS